MAAGTDLVPLSCTADECLTLGRRKTLGSCCFAEVVTRLKAAMLAVEFLVETEVAAVAEIAIHFEEAAAAAKLAAVAGSGSWSSAN